MRKIFLIVFGLVNLIILSLPQEHLPVKKQSKTVVYKKSQKSSKESQRVKWYFKIVISKPDSRCRWQVGTDPEPDYQ